MNDDIHERETPRNKIYPISTFKERDNWIKLLLAADGDTLSSTHKIVATRVALHLNIETGQCNPSLPQLAAGTDMSDRNVRRMLNDIEQAGWLIVDRSLGGRRSVKTYNSNSFVLSVPITRSDMSALNPDAFVRVKGSNPDKPGRLTRTTGDANPDTVVTHIKANPTAKRKAKKIDSSLPDLGGQDDSGLRSQSPNSQTEIDTDFEVFWKAYPRKDDKGKARIAYRRVIAAKKATVEKLLNGAMCYAAERCGQDPRFTKYASTWLAAESWNNEPADNATYSTSTPGRPNHAALAEQMARQVMGEDDGHVQ